MTIRVSNQIESVLHWPGMRSEYALLAPHEGFSVTKPHQIGASFTNHRGLVYQQGGHEMVRDVAAGAVFVTGTEAINWSRVRERTEALEIYPDLDLLREAAVQRGRHALTIEPAAFVRDPVVLAVAAVLKRVHVTGTYLSDMAASTLFQRLADQIVEVYAGDNRSRRPSEENRSRLYTLRRVSDYIEAHLGCTITLQQLADVAHLSPFHFARTFKRATGMTPYQFVTMRRIEQAKCELLRSNRTVAQIAASVHFSNLSHFRRIFRMYYGVSPSDIRQ